MIDYIEKLNTLMKGEVLAEVSMTCMESVEMKPIIWLWPGRIARGKITVCAGNPGLGKSQIMAYLTAIVSRGASWPDGLAMADVGNVIILSAEDDAADTIKPRLVAAAADLNRCYVLEGIRQAQGDRSTVRVFDLSRDIERLGEAVERLGNVRLVIIDPISSYLGSADSHNNAEIRGLLAPLSVLAAQYGFAVVLVTHLNKSKDQDMMARITGSIGLIAAARAGYAVTKDEKNPDIRYMIPVKNNVGDDKNGFSFRIESVVLPQGLQTSKVCWLPGVVDAQTILQPQHERKSEGAIGFLRDVLSSGPKPANEIFRLGDKAGYSRDILRRAANNWGIRRKKLGMEGGWEWRLSEDRENTEGGEDSGVMPGLPLPR